MTIQHPQTPSEWETLFSCLYSASFNPRYSLVPPHKLIANLHACQEKGFRIACEYGHLETVKFLATSQSLLDFGHTFPDLHARDESAFRWACHQHQWNVVQFLIFDLKIPLTSSIQELLETYPDLEFYFQARDEQLQLKHSLSFSPMPPSSPPLRI